jgi:hypothetical protein
MPLMVDLLASNPFLAHMLPFGPFPGLFGHRLSGGFPMGLPGLSYGGFPGWSLFVDEDDYDDSEDEDDFGDRVHLRFAFR